MVDRDTEEVVEETEVEDIDGDIADVEAEADVDWAVKYREAALALEGAQGTIEAVKKLAITRGHTDYIKLCGG